jgi:hypothetical protein
MNHEATIPTGRTTRLWPTRSTPLWDGDQLIGFLAVASSSRGTFTGTLSPGPAFEEDRELFEAAVAAEKAIGQSRPDEYQAAWQAWQQACQQLQQLDLSFGDLHIPIEEFAIDADWRVEFESALWWDALNSPSFAAAKSSHRWR